MVMVLLFLKACFFNYVIILFLVLFLKSALLVFYLLEVLPSLREKHGEFVLKELVKRWSNNKVMTRWMSRFFRDLDRRYVLRKSLPSLKQVAFTCFRELVNATVACVP